MSVNDVRIDSVDAIQLEAPLDRSFGYAQDWVDARTATLVRIEASNGTVGWGECFGPLAGTGEVVTDLLGPALLGEDPRTVESLYDAGYDLARRSYQTTVPLPALSGVDIALWDLRGKLEEASVATLLGDPRREMVQAYATGHYFRPTRDRAQQHEAIISEARANAAAIGAIKLKVGLSILGYGPDEDLELVHDVVDAIPADTTVMVDANYAYDRPTAERVGGVLSDLGVAWFEEPISPEDEAGYRALSCSVSVPIAAGECHTAAALVRLLVADAVDVAQPDVCAIGGLTPAHRIAARMPEFGTAQLVPHVWGTPVAQAASLQLIANIPGPTWVEWDRSPNPLRDDLVPDHPSVDVDGRVELPDGPGLGVTPNLDSVECYLV